MPCADERYGFIKTTEKLTPNSNFHQETFAFFILTFLLKSQNIQIDVPFFLKDDFDVHSLPTEIQAIIVFLKKAQTGIQELLLTSKKNKFPRSDNKDFLKDVYKPLGAGLIRVRALDVNHRNERKLLDLIKDEEQKESAHPIDAQSNVLNEAGEDSIYDSVDFSETYVPNQMYATL